MSGPQGFHAAWCRAVLPQDVGPGGLGAELLRGVPEPDPRVVRGGDHLGRRRVLSAEFVDAHLHVGLAGADPDVAEHHVVGSHAAVELDHMGPSRRDRIERDAPAAVGTRGGGPGLADEFDVHRLPGILRPAPDGQLLVALQHHVVAEDIRQPAREPYDAGVVEEHERVLGLLPFTLGPDVDDVSAGVRLAILEPGGEPDLPPAIGGEPKVAGRPERIRAEEQLRPGPAPYPGRHLIEPGRERP